MAVAYLCAGWKWEAKAGAATYTTSCATGDDSCVAILERLETLVALQESANVTLGQIQDNTTVTGSPAEVAGTVALAPGDQNRVDLIWWGVWFAPGLLIGFWIGGRAWRHFKGWA